MTQVIKMNSANSDKAPDDASATVAEGIGPIPYMLAAVSFMPLLGVITGPIAIIWGLKTLNRGGKVVAIIGGGGFLGQTFFFSFLFHGFFS